MRRPRLTPLLLVAVALLLAGTPAAAAAGSVPAATVTGGAPLPPKPGIGLDRNQDGEPGMGVDGDGTFWIASDIAPYAASDPRSQVAVSGADIWKSTDGGRTYTWVADPFTTTGNNPGLGGEDTDLTVAPEKNPSGHYNIYATSLYIGGSAVAISTDGGATFTTYPLGPTGQVPVQDRPWLAADGPCVFYISYHQLPLFTPVFNRYDVCNLADTGTGTVLNYTQSTNSSLSTFPGLSNAFGKQVVDNSPTSPHRHAIYLPMQNCYTADPTQSATDLVNGCTQNTDLLVAVSTDGGMTFNDYEVARGTNAETVVWPATVATDAAGTVYFVWTDNHNSYLNVSTDGGQHWTASRVINTGAAATAVYPTVAAGAAGAVDIGFYGTDRSGDSNDSKAMGLPNKAGAADWFVYLATSRDGGTTFGQSQVTQRIHTGELCTQGGGCADTNARNLLDDFGVAISPTTGLASVTYTSDQPQGVAPTAFTGYTSELAQPAGTDVPEAPVAGLLPLAGVVVLGTAVAVRRRRAPGARAA